MVSIEGGGRSTAEHLSAARGEKPTELIAKLLREADKPTADVVVGTFFLNLDQVAGALWSAPCLALLADTEIGVPDLALDDDQRDALAGHLDSVAVAEPMRAPIPRGLSRPGATVRPSDVG